MKLLKSIDKLYKIFFFFSFLVIGIIFLGVFHSRAADNMICAPKNDNCFSYSGVRALCTSGNGCSQVLREVVSGDGYSSSIVFCAALLDPNNCYDTSASDCVSRKSSYCQLVSLGSVEVSSGGGVNSQNKQDNVKKEENPDDDIIYQSPFPSLTDPMQSIGSPQSLLGKIINIIMGMVGSLALIMFIFGGISWMTAGGNEQKVKQSIGIIVWSALGLAVIFLSYALASLIIKSIK